MVSTHLNLDVLAQQALVDLQSGRAAAAESRCLKVLSADNRHPSALTVLGMVLHMQARYDDAIRVFNALTQIEPRNSQHWGNLGTSLRSAGRYDDAIAVLKHALTLDSASPGLLYNLGLAHIDRCEHEAAYGVLQRAVALAPQDATLRLGLAQCCYDLTRFEEASDLLKEWRNFAGLTPDLIAQIAYLLVTMGEAARAESAIELLERGPQSGRATLMLARVLERVNRLNEARAALSRVKLGAEIPAADPDLLLAEAVLAQRESQHEAACEYLNAALRNHRDFPRRHQLLFPLANSLDALGRCDEAHATLLEAHRSQLAYVESITGKTPDVQSPTMSLAQRGCDAADVAAWNHDNAPGAHDSPIFIVAFPRSGTTLLEQTLDAHPSLRSMDEQPFLKKALDDVVDCGIRYPAELAKLSADQLTSIRERYLRRVAAKVDLQSGLRLVDKNPLNLMRLPLIRRLFPNASLILAIRHPCDTLLSCFFQHFRAPDLALMCRDLCALAENYRSAFDFWYEQAALLGPNVYEVRYERFVQDFHAQVRRLSEFLQLPWNDAVLEPGRHALAKGFISTPSYSQVLQPISGKSIGKWKGYEAYFTEALPRLKPLIERWEYAL